VEEPYRASNKALVICLQYQMEVAGRMVDLLASRQSKLAEIKEFEKMNKEIIEHNKKLNGKKQMRQLLNIPKSPVPLLFRFFRDIVFLKTMIRGELELNLRKTKKKKRPLLFLRDCSPSKFEPTCSDETVLR
jgi:hypothetical protein